MNNRYGLRDASGNHAGIFTREGLLGMPYAVKTQAEQAMEEIEKTGKPVVFTTLGWSVQREPESEIPAQAFESKGAGRPRFEEGLQKPRNYLLSDRLIRKAKKIGSGVASEGIRKAVVAYKGGQEARDRSPGEEQQMKRVIMSDRLAEMAKAIGGGKQVVGVRAALEAFRLEDER